ncbi:hypothetical protein [Gulbenkiania mobilis]|uniref:hypothetical protein n=1 Tax=Gulbenkiania mobilis TaxID=397457 RepID=UPI001052743A
MERPQLASDGLSTDTLAALTQALNMRGPLTPGATRPGILSYREVRRFTQQGGRVLLMMNNNLEDGREPLEGTECASPPATATPCRRAWRRSHNN